MGLERINEIKKQKGLTNAQLADKANLTLSTLDKITSGYNTNPKLATVEAICKALGCTISDLLSESPVPEKNNKANNIQDSFSSNEKQHIKKYRTLDEHGKKIVDVVLNEEYERCTYEEEDTTPKIKISYSFIPASAGTGAFLDEQNIEMREFPDTLESRQADIVIPVDGDSMEPMFYDGDELYVRLQPAVEIGEIGIFEIGDKGYVKKYAADRLISLNPKYDDIYPDEYHETRCVGKVIGKVE